LELFAYPVCPVFPMHPKLKGYMAGTPNGVALGN